MLSMLSMLNMLELSALILLKNLLGGWVKILMKSGLAVSQTISQLS
jgi:hypothetical protein